MFAPPPGSLADDGQPVLGVHPGHNSHHARRSHQQLRDHQAARPAEGDEGGGDVFRLKLKLWEIISVQHLYYNIYLLTLGFNLNAELKKN